MEYPQSVVGRKLPVMSVASPVIFYWKDCTFGHWSGIRSLAHGKARLLKHEMAKQGWRQGQSDSLSYLLSELSAQCLFERKLSSSSSSSSSSSQDRPIGPLPAKCWPEAFHATIEKGGTHKKGGRQKRWRRSLATTISTTTTTHHHH